MDFAEVRARLADVVVTNVTPFTADGAVDYDTAARHAQFLVDNGIRVVVPAGNTGEFSSLGFDEVARLTASVAEAVGNRALVVGGVGWSLPYARDLAIEAEKAGAHAVMVHHPTHTYIHRDALRRYFEGIMEAINIGVILYKRGPELTDDLIYELVQHEQVVGVKYAVNDMNAFTNLVDRTQAPVAWVCGTAERWAPFFALGGAVGFTSGLANFAPKKALALRDALNAGDYARAMAVRREILEFEELRQHKFSANNVPAVKEACGQLGLCLATVRDPLQELDPEEKQLVTRILKEWNLLA